MEELLRDSLVQLRWKFQKKVEFLDQFYCKLPPPPPPSSRLSPVFARLNGLLFWPEIKPHCGN